MYPRAIGEAFQVNGVWYQDYEVQRPNGTVEKQRYMHNGTDWVEAPAETSDDYTLGIMNMIPDSTAGVSLKKNVVSLNKTIISLSKSKGVSLTKHRARVAIALDYSYSMKRLFETGAVQRALSRLVPLGLKFDDNGELEVWLFSNDYCRIDEMTLNNFDNYVNTVINNSGYSYGGTSYSPVIFDIIKKYTKEDPDSIPTFVIFITDGENSDQLKTNNAIVDSANYNIFIQFVGIGNERFRYLQQLDDLEGRRCDNTGFIKVSDFDNMDDETLYNNLLEQYIDWLKVLNLG